MEFRINPMCYTGIFPVPNKLVDEDIRLASAVQLKALLYLLRYGNERKITLQVLSKELFTDEAELEDAMLFWKDRGMVLISDGESAAVIPEQRSSVVPFVQENPKLPFIALERPDHQQVAARLSESRELASFFCEAQQLLGRVIGYEGQSSLLMIHDGYGMPLEVLLMAISYCVEQKKTGMRQIIELARRWSEQGVDTIEGVNRYIEEHTVVDQTWEELRKITDIANRHPTEKQRSYLTCWTREMGYGVQMIHCAYEQSVDNTGKMNIKYMDKVLRSWYENGIRTLEQVNSNEEKWKTINKKRYSSPKKEKPQSSEASYDVQLYNEEAVNIRYIKSENN